MRARGNCWSSQSVSGRKGGRVTIHYNWGKHHRRGKNGEVNKQVIPVGDGAGAASQTHAVYFVEMKRRSCTGRWVPTGRVNPHSSGTGEQSACLTLEQTPDWNSPPGALGRICCQPNCFLGAVCRRLFFLRGDKQDQEPSTGAGRLPDVLHEAQLLMWVGCFLYFPP